MSASWRCDRRGVGGVVALVLWLVAMALVWALIQSQAGSGAITGVARATGLRAVLYAGRAALTEASWAIRHPPASGGPLAALKDSPSGDPFDPVLTRQLLKDDIGKGFLEIGRVELRVAQKPPEEKPKKPWFIDLSVKVRCRAGSGWVARTLRRRHIGWLHRTEVTMGPMVGQVLSRDLSMEREPIIEVADP